MLNERGTTPTPPEDNEGNDHLTRQTYVEAVVTRLREDILSGTLTPGARVRIQALSKRFGISQIPIREALRTLEAEGLIVTAPSKAMSIVGVTLDDLQSLYDFRRLTEPPLSCRAANQASPSDIIAMREQYDALATADRASPRFWNIHRAFHRALLQPVLTGWAQTVSEQLWQASERYARLFIAYASFDDAMSQHREMAAAFEAGDGRYLEELTSAHLTWTEGCVREGYVRLRTNNQSVPLDI